MSASQSFLSSPQFGYDFVVSTTQASINAEMKRFLATLPEPAVTSCYIADSHGNPSEVAYADLVKAAYGSDPLAVQAEIQNLGGQAFSVQQLLFDLSNAALESVPTITGLPPGSKVLPVLQQYFLGAYFTQMQKAKVPLLGCFITQGNAPAATLTLTSLNLEVCPFVGPNGLPVQQPTPDQQNLATLNYLCAADGDSLPAPVPFGWNWIDAPEE